MKTTLAIIALMASLASAQLADIPSCALNCFISAVSDDGCSNLTDFACHCQKTELIAKAQPCVQSACNAQEIPTVLTKVEEICSSAGHPVTINLVSAASPVASAATTAASAAATTTRTPSSTATTRAATAATGAASRPTQVAALMAALGLAAAAL